MKPARGEADITRGNSTRRKMPLALPKDALPTATESAKVLKGLIPERPKPYTMPAIREVKKSLANASRMSDVA